VSVSVTIRLTLSPSMTLSYSIR